METSNRPFTSEPLRLANAVEDEDQPVGSSCSTEERLDDLHRSEECIPTAVVFSGLLWIERFTSSRHFVSLHGPSCVHQGHGSCVCHASRPRRPDAPVPG